MQAKILSTKQEGSTTCYLCEITLLEFIDHLPDSFMEYDIQRGVVANIYLDNLIDTVLKRSSIPPITLIIEESSNSGNDVLSILRYKILDGLQRTIRLKIIWDTINFFDKVVDHDILDLSKFQLSRKYGKQLQEIGSSVHIFEKIITYYRDNGYLKETVFKSFGENTQWFIVWDNVSPEMQVEKMLILNAGHKPVSIRHQLELLFLNLLPYFSQREDFQLIREKEMASTVYGKRREVGQFHFAHIISAVLSFANGETITTNASLINKLQEDDNKIDKYKQYFTYDFLNAVVKFLIQLDNLLVRTYGSPGTQWIGRETVMVGIFGAIGRVYQERDAYITYEDFFRNIFQKLQVDAEYLNLSNYDEFRNNMNLGKVNVGNVSKKAIYNGIYHFIKNNQESPIDWQKFEGGSK